MRLEKRICDNENLEKLKKLYKYLNITLLILAIYAIFYPVISKILVSIHPSFGICAFNVLTNSQCPLCGGTRFFENILINGFDSNMFSSPFMIMFIVLIIELLLRIILIIKYKKITKNIFILDLIWHSIIFISYISYLILFFVE